MKIKAYIKALYKKKKKGEYGINTAIGLLILLMVICFGLDLYMLSTQTTVLTEMSKELARTISVQGGALNTKPDGYANNYYTISDLGGFIQDSMRSAGYKDCDWYVTITYTKEYVEKPDHTWESQDSTREQKIIYCSDTDTLITEPTSRIDYLSSFTIKIYTRYKWKFISGFIPSTTSYIHTTMPGTSEWKWNFDSWESES